MPKLVPDPSTQIYQAILATLKAFPPVAAQIVSIMDMSSQNFQQLARQYASGQMPAILLKPVTRKMTFFRGSVAPEVVEELGLFISTDYQNVLAINAAYWLAASAIYYANSQGQKFFGLLTATPTPLMVRDVQLIGGQLGLGEVPGAESDNAAKGAARFVFVAGWRVTYNYSWAEGTNLAQAYIAAQAA